MNQVAGKPYDFKHLAHFVDDIKFLLTRGGDNNASQNETLTKKILGWMVFFVLILVILYILYLVYSMVFRGYSRTLRDIFTLSFSNQVDTSTSIGSEDSQFHRALVALQNSKLKDAYALLAQYGYPVKPTQCNGDGCTNVFSNLFNTIDTYYESEFGSEKNMKAITEFYMFFSQTQKHLSLNTTNFDNRISKMTNMIDKLYKYEELYNDILDVEVQLVCHANTSTNDIGRRNKEREKQVMQDTLKRMFDTNDIKPVTTAKDFASYYTAPVYKARCGKKSLKQFYTEVLSKTPHARLIKEIQQIVRDMAKSNSDLKSATSDKVEGIRSRIQQLRKQKLSNEISMARYRKMAQEQAEAQYRQQTAEVLQQIKTSSQGKSWEKDAKKAFKKIGRKVTNIFKPKSKQRRSTPNQPAPQPIQQPEPEATFNASATQKNIIQYEQDNVTPLLENRRDGQQNKVYVPCYHIYHQYVVMNKKEKFRDGKMTDDELVAYVFMKDYQMIQSRSVNDDVTAVPVLERILRMQIAMEMVANMTSFAINDIGRLRKYLYHIFMASDATMEVAKNDIMRNQEIITAYQQNNFDKVTTSTSYSWYLMELLCMIHPSNPLTFETCLNQLISSTRALSIEKLQTLNTYLNISKKPLGLMQNLNLEPSLIDFATRHPIFTTIYLSQVVPIDTRSLDKATLNTKLNSAKDTSASLHAQIARFIAVLLPPVRVWNDKGVRLEGVKPSLDMFKRQVHSLKEVFIYMHIVHLYVSEYKTTTGLKEREKEDRLVKEGFVELISDQLITENEFFMKLITPFKNDLIDTRVVGAWKDLFYGDRFKQDSNISYWRDFKAYWIDYLRPQAERTVKNVWGDVGKTAKTRFA